MPPLLPINLYSDNVAVAAPEIMAALARVNAGPAQPYGQDAETHAMKIAFSDLFGTEVWVMPVSTGTAANAIALSALTPPFGTILCSDVAHVETSECGATEMFSGGAKLTRVPSKAGQMSADVLDEVIRKAGKGLQHRSQPAAVNLTIGTERGTAYPVNDIARIAEVAKKHGLYFHIDGARMANALVALGTSARSVTTDLGVDVLSFGATKNGTLNTEAIVVFRKQIAEELRYRLRRAGQVWSKMRYSAAQLPLFSAVPPFLFTPPNGARVAFLPAKAGLRMVAQSMARDYGPLGIHVAHVVIDGGIDGERLRKRAPTLIKERGEDGLLDIDAIAETYWQIHRQPRSAWTQEVDLRPFKEPF